jgi:hypothetical protein
VKKNILKAIILTGILLLTYRFGHFQQALVQPLAAVPSYVTQREAELWNTLESHGISKKEFEKRKQAKAKAKKAVKAPKQDATPEAKKLIYHIATDYGMNPVTIQIETVTDAQACDAWVNKQTLKINEPIFTQADDQAKTFIIAHELQHIIHDDHEDRYTLGDLIVEAGIDKAMENELLNNFYRFQEERADALAAAKNAEYAKAYEYCMQYFKTNYGLMDNPEHPKLVDRIALANRIVAGFDATKMV